MRNRFPWAVIGAAALALGSLAPTTRAQEALKGNICYSQKEGDSFWLHVMDADGKNDRAIPNLPNKVNIFPSWSPDGKQVAFASGESAEVEMGFGLYVINVDGTGLKRIGENEKIAALGAWSPDGKRLAYTVDRGNKPKLASSAPDGSDARDIDVGLEFAVAPFYSPDGKRIGFAGSKGGGEPMQVDLHLANPDGSDVQQLTMGGGFYLGGAGSWSPDGKSIAVIKANMEMQTADLIVWTLSDKAEAKLIDVKLGNKSFVGITLPGWSPDGKWLIIGSLEGEKGVLLRVSPDGKTQEKVGPADASCHCPAWSRG